MRRCSATVRLDTGHRLFPDPRRARPTAMAKLVEVRGHTAVAVPPSTATSAGRRTARRQCGAARKYAARRLFVALPRRRSRPGACASAAGSALVVEATPIITAKEVASVDVFSGGRLDFGVGRGGTERDGQSRHGPTHADAAHARARRGDAGHLDAGGGDLRRRVRDFDRIWSWPKPLQRRGRPSSWAAAGRRSSITSWPSATWFAQHRERPLERIDEPARGRRRPAGTFAVDVDRRPYKAEGLERYEAAGSRVDVGPVGGPGGDRARPRGLRARGRRPARRVTPQEARRRFAAARVARLATADAAGARTVPVVFAGRRHHRQRGRRQAQADHQPAATGQRRREPRRRPAGRPLRGGLVGAVVGARRRERVLQPQEPEARRRRRPPAQALRPVRAPPRRPAWSWRSTSPLVGLERDGRRMKTRRWSARSASYSSSWAATHRRRPRRSPFVRSWSVSITIASAR